MAQMDSSEVYKFISPQIPQILGNESNKFTLKVSSKQHFEKVLLWKTTKVCKKVKVYKAVRGFC